MANLRGGCVVINQNWFENNSPYGLRQLDTSVVWDVSNNYWGDPSGPYHPTENPNGHGDTVDVSCHVTPWLTEPPILDANPHVSTDLIPDTWTLEKIYPNPFNSTVNIKLVSPTTVSLQVAIYDITGRQLLKNKLNIHVSTPCTM